jgi:ABC-2 type transport system permease protein
MTATTASTHGIPGRAEPGFGAALQSEWTKLRTVRSTWIIIALAISLSIGFSALVALVTGLTFDDWNETARASFDPVGNSMAGLLFSMTLLIVLGVTAVTSEYGSGMIRTTLIVSPRRTRVFAAKATIVGALGIAIGAIATPGMFLISQAIFGSYGLATASASDSTVVRHLIVYSLGYGVVYTLVPLSIAFLLRGAASGITASIGLLYLPWMLAPVLPAWLQDNVLRFFPDLAIDSLAGFMPQSSATYLSDTSAAVALAVWLAGSLAIAGFVLSRRDA